MKNWRLLIIDPNSRTRQLLTEELRAEHLTVMTANSGCEGFLVFQKETIDLVITEAYFPQEDDLQVVKKIKAISDIPIMVLSDCLQDSLKIQAFELGVADYVAKPFNPREVFLRVERLLSYFYQPSPLKIAGSHYVYPFMTLDLVQREVIIAHKQVKLTPREFQLLAYFVKRPNQVISREELLHGVWGYEFFGEERTVDVHIRNLRNKLKVYSEIAANAIQTERNRGYYFDDKVAQVN